MEGNKRKKLDHVWTCMHCRQLAVWLKLKLLIAAGGERATQTPTILGWKEIQRPRAPNPLEASRKYQNFRNPPPPPPPGWPMDLSVVPSLSLSLSPRRALPLPARRAARRPAFVCRCSCSPDASPVATRRLFASLLATAAGSWLLCSMVVWFCSLGPGGDCVFWSFLWVAWRSGGGWRGRRRRGSRRGVHEQEGGKYLTTLYCATSFLRIVSGLRIHWSCEVGLRCLCFVFVCSVDWTGSSGRPRFLRANSPPCPMASSKHLPWFFYLCRCDFFGGTWFCFRYFNVLACAWIRVKIGRFTNIKFLLR